jgi:hypothetical protein
MPSMDLFKYARPLTFAEKVASIEVGEDQNLWSRKILTELYRTLPEASSYAPKVNFMRVDEEQGFALGVVTLDGSTNSALASATQEGATPNAVHIPLIIRNHVMAPLDIMLVGNRLLPLSAERLREALFRPQPFDMLTDDWGDTSLLAFFQLPGRTDIYPNSGFSGGSGDGVTTMFGPGAKTSAANYEVLETIAPTLLKQDLVALADRFADPVLYEAATKNAAYLGALQLLSKVEHVAEKTAHEDALYAAAAVKGTDVVQIGYDDGSDRYFVKAASRQAYLPMAQHMTRGEVLKFAGDEVVQKVDTQGAVTIAAESADGDKGLLADNASKWVVVEEPGIYKVKTVDGREMTGWVLPNLIDFDGIRVPMAVFTNGAAATVQDQIAGARVASGSDLTAKAPKGTGVFYVSGPSGIEATVPVEIVGQERSVGDSIAYHVRTLTDGEHVVRLVPGLKGLRVVGHEAFIPDTARFMPLDTETAVPLIRTPGELTKTASYLAAPAIRVLSDGDTSRLEFHGTPKLAQHFSGNIPNHTAVFALCLAGLDAQTANTKVASAVFQTVEVRGVSDIRDMADLQAEVRPKAAALSKLAMSLRRDLTKEAAVLPDVQTMDSVLSLNFLNSENLRAYIAKLPALEKSLSSICHLLLAARLGLTEVPESAAARCIRGLDDVCRGLRTLGLRDFSGPDDAS